MSGGSPEEAVVSSEPGERLLTFEIGGTLYALPIASVCEVVPVGPLACVPTRTRESVGVMNYHGDALPVVERALLLGLPEAQLGEPEQVLAIAGPRSNTAQLGLPVDKVTGLVDGGLAPTRGTELVVEHRSIEGRVVSVLDPFQLLARAREVIERSVSETGAFQGGRG